jgi:hypothetical protein
VPNDSEDVPQLVRERERFEDLVRGERLLPAGD